MGFNGLGNRCSIRLSYGTNRSCKPFQKSSENLFCFCSVATMASLVKAWAGGKRAALSRDGYEAPGRGGFATSPMSETHNVRFWRDAVLNYRPDRVWKCQATMRQLIIVAAAGIAAGGVSASADPQRLTTARTLRSAACCRARYSASRRTGGGIRGGNATPLKIRTRRRLPPRSYEHSATTPACRAPDRDGARSTRR